MGSRLLRGILLAAILTLVFNSEARAEQAYLIILPDVIKGSGQEQEQEQEALSEIGDFEDYTEIPQNPPLTRGHMEMLQKIAIAEGGDDVQAMAYIIQTVLNRVHSDKFPDTISGVISQKGQFSAYPDKYNKAAPSGLSVQALDLAYNSVNKGQLYFENPKPGSWQSENLKLLFTYKSLAFSR